MSLIDTKFSVALHILTMISGSKEVLTSQVLAASVGTNPSYIRKVIALLKMAGLIQSYQGKAGYQLGRPAKDMTLLEIYFATQEISQISLFQQHQQANQDCPVGKHIAGAVTPIFSRIEQDLERELGQQTLDHVIANLYQAAKQTRI